LNLSKDPPTSRRQKKPPAMVPIEKSADRMVISLETLVDRSVRR
jgi:hypothetical protein